MNATHDNSDALAEAENTDDHAREGSAQEPQRHSARDTRPVIHVSVGDPPVVAAIRALRADENLFVRDSSLVHVVRAETGDEGDVDQVAAGTPRIHVAGPPTIRLRLCRVARWERTKKNKDGKPETVRCEPTRAFAEELILEKSFPGLRRLDGVCEAPFPRRDGTIVQEPGYDSATRYLYVPSCKFPHVGDTSQQEAAEALALLDDLFVDFPFASPAGRAATIAALLTLIARPGIIGPVPAFIMDATTPATGKTLLADVCAAVAYGRDAGRHHFPFASGMDGDTELSKALASVARRGAQLVNFDNADNTEIGGDVLEDVISARHEYTFRILGKTEDLTVPWRTVIFATANNASWSRGMSRRILHIRLESPFEKPEHRPLDSYRHPERAGRMFEYAIEHRPALVHACLTVLRAYVVADKPDKLTLGTFENWAGLIPSAIVFAGGANPMDCRPSQSGDESPDTTFARVLVQQWALYCEKTGLGSVTASQVVSALYPKDRDHDPNDGWEDFRGAVEHFLPTRPGQAPSATALAVLISKRFKGCPVRTMDAPAPLQRLRADGLTHGRQRWCVEDVLISRVEPLPRDPDDADSY